MAGWCPGKKCKTMRRIDTWGFICDCYNEGHPIDPYYEQVAWYDLSGCKDKKRLRTLPRRLRKILVRHIYETPELKHETVRKTNCNFDEEIELLKKALGDECLPS